MPSLSMKIRVLLGVVSSALIAMTTGCSWMGNYSPLAAVERSQVFQPVKYPEGDWQPTQKIYEDAWFSSGDGTELHGWFLPHPRPRAIVLLAHGNAGNLTHRTRILQQLHDRHQVSVMIFDYRGYGKSAGTPNEDGVLQDARAARKWLARRTGVAEHEIVLMGRSLGGGVMVDLAAKDGARGLILESTFTSLPDVAQNMMPVLPAKLIMTTRLDSLSKIADYNGPLLQSHGDEDRLIPIRFARMLFKKSTGKKQFIVIRGGGHNCGMTEEYHQALNDFFTSLPPTVRRRQDVTQH